LDAAIPAVLIDLTAKPAADLPMALGVAILAGGEPDELASHCVAGHCVAGHGVAGHVFAGLPSIVIEEGTLPGTRTGQRSPPQPNTDSAGLRVYSSRLRGRS
jgi:hypothetical protein